MVIQTITDGESRTGSWYLSSDVRMVHYHVFGREDFFCLIDGNLIPTKRKKSPSILPDVLKPVYNYQFKLMRQP